MKMKPKKYQQEVLSALEDKRAKNAHRALVVMATGLGKTAVAAFDVENYMKNNRGKLLFLCHNNGILAQNQEAFKSILDEEFSYGLYNGIEKIPEAEFLFASFQTMSTHKEEFNKDEFSYIIVDEAHHAPAGTYQGVIDYFRPDFLLGLTATPNRLDGVSLEETFGPVTYDLGLVEAVHRGLLVDIDYHLVLDEMADLDSISVDDQKLSMGELNKRLFIPKRDEEMVNIILEKNRNSSMLVFCCSIEHAEAIHALLPNSEIVHSKRANEENEQALNAFRNGELSILISVDMLNEGIDVPHADTIVFLRSTVSPVVFYQQLGRGLRTHEGKSKATVLDFVGNAERLNVVAKLQDEINELRVDNSNDADEELAEKEHFVLNIDAKQFRDQEIDIISIIDRINNLSWGYSDEELIKQVQMLARELGRTPKAEEFNKDRRTASTEAAKNRFGSWNKFLEAAGLKTHGYSDEELIKQVQMLARELGRTPKAEEFNKDRRTASFAAVKNRFGYWNKFLDAAGLNTHSYSDEELIKQVQMLARELGRTPTLKEFNDDQRTASAEAAKNRFGSWNKFLEAAGLKTNRSSVSDEELIQQVQMLARELGRTPRMREFSKDRRTASTEAAKNRFGSWNKFLEAAGLKTHGYSDEELIKQVQMLARELGRTPKAEEFNKDRRTASFAAVKNRFGYWNKFLDAAGLKK